MERLARIAAINDLSGFGRCSLTVALPVLSAMGFQACPVPTAVLSAHTGYEEPYICDFSAHIEPYLRHWDAMPLTFEGVFTGYLGNEGQVTALLPFMQYQQKNGALCVVDPVMADNGRLYATCTPALVAGMRRLVALADVTTPNLTEACLLTGMDYAACLDGTVSIETVGEKMAALGCRQTVITGVPGENGTLGNVAFDHDTGERFCVSVPRLDRSYAGTGDVFSAVLCGRRTAGSSLRTAVEDAAAFVRVATEYTAARALPEQDGIVFEPFLGRLAREMAE